MRELQRGETLTMPHSRTMPSIGRRCHELRVVDSGHNWRVILRLDVDAIVIAEVFDKKTKHTPAPVIECCKERLRRYDEVVRERKST